MKTYNSVKFYQVGGGIGKMELFKPDGAKMRKLCAKALLLGSFIAKYKSK